MAMSAFGPTRRAGRRRLSSPALRREHEESRNTIAQGMPDCFGVPVVTCLRAFFIRTQGCGCDKHPAFPAPLCPENLSGCANGRLDQNRPLLELSPLRPKAIEPVDGARDSS